VKWATVSTRTETQLGNMTDAVMNSVLKNKIKYQQFCN